MIKKIIVSILIICLKLNYIQASQHDDVRCKCVCPDPNVLIEELANTSTKADARKLYIDSVPPQHCNCDWMVLPKLDSDLYRNKSKELCPRCECKYESRNLGTIKWVITGTVIVVTLLTGYMLFLMAIEYLHGTGQRISYQEHINEEVVSMESSDANNRNSSSLDDVTILPSKNVMNRVNQQQSKWKRQIIEQRKNIYDKHTMLN